MIPKGTNRITAEWLDKVLHNSGYLKDFSIESISREPWGVGEGFMSDMARLKITYDKEYPGLPKTMIAKMPTTFKTAKAVALQYNVFEKEIRFYNEIAPKSSIRVPDLIYSDYDLEAKKFILILEDCSCYELADQIKGLNYEQTKQAIISIADFHARWWDAPDLFSFPWIFLTGEETPMSYIDTFRNSWDLAVKSEEFLEILPEGGLEVGEKIYKHFPELINDFRMVNLTMTHFDYRADNMFFDFENNENPVITFDWGSLLVGRGIMDIAYLLALSIEIDSRRQIEKEMIRLYLKRLEEKEINGFDFDMAWDDYLQALVGYMPFLPIAFTQLDRSDPRAIELGKVSINRLFGAIIDNDAISIFPS
ncbi:hypothetical protein LCGC14_0737490 [marine sediment metagenome]|uniref:CHK kinase-like domain-containing protein n=1 Tax=marine sediment metagenome TaxID=412755 RepID=A0A0F9QSN9_9ZZZZ